MNLEEVLPPASVSLDIPLTDKARAISHVAGLLASQAGIAGEIVEGALLAREALGSTGVGGGIALPHARLHVRGKTHAVFLRLATPIEFESADAKPVDLLCAIIAPDEPNADLLTAVAAISRTLRNADKTAALRESHDAGEARATLLSGAASNGR